MLYVNGRKAENVITVSRDNGMELHVEWREPGREEPICIDLQFVGLMKPKLFVRLARSVLRIIKIDEYDLLREHQSSLPAWVRPTVNLSKPYMQELRERQEPL